jgi:hypothetical protein
MDLAQGRAAAFGIGRHQDQMHVGQFLLWFACRYHQISRLEAMNRRQAARLRELADYVHRSVGAGSATTRKMRGLTRSVSNVLAAWLGDDRAGIEELLNKFRDSAIESEQAIDTAWRAADLAGLAAAAHRLKGAAKSSTRRRPVKPWRS